MKKIILILIFILSSIISFGQNDQENKISQLINKLDWNTVKIESDLALFVTQSDSVANNLVKIGKPATEFLLKALKISEKTVASHIILTRIYEAENYKNHSSGTIPIYQNCHDLIGRHHFYNGINWKIIFKKEKSISQNQIDLASNYWNKKLLLKEQITLPNGAEIFEALDKENKVNYPCDEDKRIDINSKKKNYLNRNQGSANEGTKYEHYGSGGNGGGNGNGTGTGAGSGDGKGNYTLAGRRVAYIPQIDNDCNQPGRVIIEVTVDKSGKTISAINAKGSNADACLIALAKKYALQTKWQASENAAEKQVGTITYNFTL